MQDIQIQDIQKVVRDCWQTKVLSVTGLEPINNFQACIRFALPAFLMTSINRYEKTP